ncbi:MAG: type I-E CRISPR-associated protein Cse1/CasA [Candidatus Aquicultorales bacterium]
MKEGINVAFDPWIPVVTTSGERELASLCAVLSEGEKFADLAVRPHERVSLMRLFLCVAHAALDGPTNYDEWLEVPKRLPNAAQTYLTDWKNSFELFHEEKPWLQVVGLSKSADGVLPDDVVDWTPVSKLNFSYATGNNTTLFDHAGTYKGRRIAIGETILSMLTYQSFSPGGLISQVYWNGVQSGKSSKDAPCVPASMIHAFLRGKDFSKTIHLNLPTYKDIRSSYGERDIGRPVWEIVPSSMADSASVQNATATYIGRLVPIPRLIRLHASGDCMLLGDGLVYPTFADGFPPEPTATVVIRQRNGKEERALLSYRPTKALWRELTAVVAKRTAEGLGGPLSLKAIQDGEECDLIVAALARDQATIVDTVESVFLIPSRLHSPDGVAAYEAEVKTAEDVASKLSWAVETYWREVDYGWEGRLKAAGPSKGALKAKLHARATTHYWTTVEKNLDLLMNYIQAIGTDALVPACELWRKMLFRTARDSFRVACGQETPRKVRAFAKGWEKLTARRDEVQSNAYATEEVRA